MIHADRVLEMSNSSQSSLKRWESAIPRALEREVRANLVYRNFTRVGAGKMPDAKTPDAKTMGRWGLVLGPEPMKQFHERM
jgi:hypothetical protein